MGLHENLSKHFNWCCTYNINFPFQTSVFLLLQFSDTSVLFRLYMLFSLLNRNHLISGFWLILFLIFRISFGMCGRFTGAELFSFSLSLFIVCVWVLTGHWLLMDGKCSLFSLRVVGISSRCREFNWQPVPVSYFDENGLRI